MASATPIEPGGAAACPASSAMASREYSASRDPAFLKKATPSSGAPLSGQPSA